MREVRLRLFEAGHCLAPEAATIRGGRLGLVRFPAMAALIEHPERGLVLFDTGYDEAFFDATRPFPERFYRWTAPVRLRAGEAVADQLATLGIAARDIGDVVLSHLHGDHVAGLHRLPDAAVHLAREGLVALDGLSRRVATRRGLLPALLPDDLASRARFFEDAPARPLPDALSPFEQGVDLLRDGSLLAVPLPGHAPGHFGLLLNEAGRGLHFLVADAAWSSRAIRENAPAPDVVAEMLGDAARGRETLARLHALHRRAPGVALTPSHCRECAERWHRVGSR